MSLITIVTNGIAVFMVWLFTSAGVSKLRPGHSSYYRQVMDQYGIHQLGLARVLILALGVLETGVGLCLLWPPARFPVVIVGMLLLSLYLFFMWRQWAQGHSDMDCGCSGPAASVKISPALFWRNGLYLAMLVVCAISADSLARDTGMAWVLSFLTGGALILLANCAEQLIGNGQKLARLRDAV